MIFFLRISARAHHRANKPYRKEVDEFDSANNTEAEE
jgi:hypothetical protein